MDFGVYYIQVTAGLRQQICLLDCIKAGILVPESDIRIDTEGVWFYRGVEMTRHDITALFFQNLHQSKSGRYFIEKGKQRYPVDVEDTAYVVWNLRWHDNSDEANETASLLLSDNTMETLDPGTLRIERNHIPYCRIKSGRFEARFSRAAYYSLADRLAYDPSTGAYYISLNNHRYSLFREHS